MHAQTVRIPDPDLTEIDAIARSELRSRSAQILVYIRRGIEADRQRMRRDGGGARGR